jgi:hypothetical protein
VWHMLAFSFAARRIECGGGRHRAHRAYRKCRPAQCQSVSQSVSSVARVIYFLLLGFL